MRNIVLSTMLAEERSSFTISAPGHDIIKWTIRYNKVS